MWRNWAVKTSTALREGGGTAPKELLEILWTGLEAGIILKYFVFKCLFTSLISFVDCIWRDSYFCFVLYKMY